MPSNGVNGDDPHGVRKARLARGWNERELARRSGVPYQRIQSLERAFPTGKAAYSRYLSDVMRALKGPDDAPGSTERFKSMAGPADDVPVYQLRTNEAGGEEMTATIIGYARRPPAVDLIADAYALQVRGRTAGSKYRPGDWIVVNPAGIAHPSSGVVLMAEDRGDVKIGEYVSETDTEIELLCWGDMVRFPRSDFPTLHVVCAVYPAV